VVSELHIQQMCVLLLVEYPGVRYVKYALRYLFLLEHCNGRSVDCKTYIILRDGLRLRYCESDATELSLSSLLPPAPHFAMAH
jgi:hypothetical protein